MPCLQEATFIVKLPSSLGLSDRKGLDSQIKRSERRIEEKALDPCPHEHRGISHLLLNL
jgi:hypothetical protein